MTVYVCPSRDIECGPINKYWCAQCPLTTMNRAIDEAVADGWDGYPLPKPPAATEEPQP